MRITIIALLILATTNLFATEYRSAREENEAWARSHPGHSHDYYQRRAKIINRKWANKKAGKKSVFESQNDNRKKKNTTKNRKKYIPRYQPPRPIVKKKYNMWFSLQSDNNGYYLRTTNDIGLVTIKIYQRLIVGDKKTKKLLVATIKANKRTYTNYRSVELKLSDKPSKHKLLIIVESEKGLTKKFYKKIKEMK